MAKKPVITAKEAAAMIPNGATIMCGGFLACGQARAIVKELVARIRANTRRKGDEGRSQGDRQSFGPYTVDAGLQAVLRDGKPVELTQREYDLVCYFLASAGRVVSREELMEKVWGVDYCGETRTVDVHVAALRRKLDLGGELTTAYKIGYRLEVLA